jgi:hypothetical protein
VVHACNPSYSGGGGRSISLSSAQAKAWDSIWETNSCEKDWGMAQVVGCLPHKWRHWVQTPFHTHTKKKNKENYGHVIATLSRQSKQRRLKWDLYHHGLEASILKRCEIQFTLIYSLNTIPIKIQTAFLANLKNWLTVKGPMRAKATIMSFYCEQRPWKEVSWRAHNHTETHSVPDDPYAIHHSVDSAT